ncbi:hypothetical protein DFP93_107112 [Aneurinibacillus soli]|uniref:Uncharacterized protein n=1 Tax=Aneurinibacillus soli TaxID=1500254 RepID=A0A0U5AXG2_9BACL|nr:DNA mismatch repair protein [Aneurinibacillus soli]PYE61721.1 hypothetical protein DFP93_107112 [Aneurinibacillus soli]BAU28421.1 hypothetical protein CB4_02595 [Aneurinibacillus soli]
MNSKVSREELIEYGINVLRTVGAHYVCDACIKGGNSCCSKCEHLEDGIGCTKRNTACTAWLCGIQKFFLQNIGLMSQWERFWSQVPGRYFREDETPDYVTIEHFINTEGIDEKKGRLLAEKISVYVQKGGDLGRLEIHLNNRYIFKKFESEKLK